MKYALTYREVVLILMQRHVLVDGKVRTDKTYPAGFMGKFLFFFLFHCCLGLSIGCGLLLCLILCISHFIPDVVSIPKTNENFRLLYDTKGRFRLHSIRDEEAKVQSL